MKVALALVVLLCLSSRASGKSHDYANPWEPQAYSYEPQRVVKHKRKKPKKVRIAQPEAKGLITVDTAAGIKITVNPNFAPKIVAFIKDLVENGYKPKQIHCHARGGHVPGSRHYSGNACDIDQRGWGKTAPTMYHVAALAHKHGLRDGGDFRDWGHIDDGQRLARVHRRARSAYAEAQPLR